MKQFTAKQFILYSAAAIGILMAVNALGILYFYYQVRNGTVKLVLNDGHEGWQINSDDQPVQLNDIKLRENKNFEEMLRDTNEKIVFLGNSVVYSPSVKEEETFVRMTEKLLNADGFSVTGVNAGVSGSEIWREFELYRNTLKKLNPKVVVWFPNRNDFSHQEEVKEKIRDFNISWKSFIKPVFYQKIAEKIYFDRSILAENFISSEHNKYYTVGLTEPLEDGILQDIRKEIISFQNELQSQNVRLVVVFLPTKAFTKFNGWNEAKSYHQLKEICDQLNIPTLQLLDVLHENGQTSNFVDYVHLNAKGQKVVSEHLSDFLKAILK